MLQRSCREYLLLKDLEGVAKAKVVAKKLKSIQTFSSILVCSISLGKTYTSLLFLTNYILYTLKIKQHCPYVVLVLASIVLS